MLSHLAKEAIASVVALGGGAWLYKRWKNGATPPPSPTPIPPAPQPSPPPASTQHATPPPGGWITGPQPGDSYGVVTTGSTPDTITEPTNQGMDPSADTSSSDAALSDIATGADLLAVL